MAVEVYTTTPKGLLTKIKAAIDAKRVLTWEYDSDGDFTHTAQQWRNRAWMRPRITPERLTLSILAPKGVTLSSEIYAIYHGRFIEMVLAHFDEYFRTASATAMPADSDVITGT